MIIWEDYEIKKLARGGLEYLREGLEFLRERGIEVPREKFENLREDKQRGVEGPERLGLEYLKGDFKNQKGSWRKES